MASNQCLAGIFRIILTSCSIQQEAESEDIKSDDCISRQEYTKKIAATKKDSEEHRPIVAKYAIHFISYICTRILYRFSRVSFYYQSQFRGSKRK